MAESKVTVLIEENFGKAVRSVESFIDAIKRFLGISKNAEKELKQVADAAEEVGDATKKTGKDAEEGSKGVSKMQSNLQKLLRSMGRVAFYRTIRAALRAVTDGLREGIQNLVQYSAAMNSLDSAAANNTMSEFASTALYVKNSLGAALMPMLQALVPVVQWIANAFVRAANAVNQFFHALKGETVFTRAKEYALDYADSLGTASGAAAELKKQIFGFDELNIFNSPSGGGGGGGADGLDYSQMFEEAQISALFDKIRKTVEKNLGKDFIARFKIKWKDVVSDWSNLSGEDIAEKILAGFYGIIGGVAGFVFGGVPGAIVGSIAGVALGVGIDTITFDGDGKLESNEFWSMIRDVITTICGAVVVVSLGGSIPLGLAVGASLTALIRTFSPEPGMQESGLMFLALLVGTVKYILGNGGLSVSTKGAGMWLIAATALTMNIISLLSSKGFTTTNQKIAAAIVEALNLVSGALTIGAVAGGMFGGIGGVLLGITIAAGLNILLNGVEWDWTPESKRQLESGAPDLEEIGAYIKARNGETTPTKPGSSGGKYLFASGGYPQTGSLFWAGESGAELVGQVGGRTTVTTQDQFASGMADIMDNTNTVILQAAQALISAVQNKDMTAVVNVGDRQIVSAYDRGKRLAGGALVE